MSFDDPVSLWISELRTADGDAAGKLWSHFVKRLSFSARRMLNPATQKVYDEDDVAVSAFNSLFAGITEGRFPELKDREGLWRLLIVITSRKVTHRHRYDQQQRRDIRRTLTDSVFSDRVDNSSANGLHQLPSREPTPEFTAAFAETCEALFDGLGDAKLQGVAALRLEGFSDSEIGERLNCSRSTVQRRLELIRRQWQQLEDAETL